MHQGGGLHGVSSTDPGPSMMRYALKLIVKRWAAALPPFDAPPMTQCWLTAGSHRRRALPGIGPSPDFTPRLGRWRDYERFLVLKYTLVDMSGSPTHRILHSP